MAQTPTLPMWRIGPAWSILVIAVVVATIADRAAAADVSCKPLFGHFESRVVTNFDPADPAACLSPVKFCTDGTVIGGLQGTFRLTIDQFIPATSVPDTGQPKVQFFIGESVISDKTSGDRLIATDTGALNLLTGQIATLLTFDSGTGAFTGATGHIVISGTADFATGINIGDFRGEVCTPAR